MQSAPAKKPSFKCPSFSVPAKKDGTEKEQKKNVKSFLPTSSGDAGKTVGDADKSTSKPKVAPSGDNKIPKEKKVPKEKKEKKEPKEKKEKKEPKEKKVKQNQEEKIKVQKEKKEKKDPSQKKENKTKPAQSEEKDESSKEVKEPKQNASVEPAKDEPELPESPKEQIESQEKEPASVESPNKQESKPKEEMESVGTTKDKAESVISSKDDTKSVVTTTVEAGSVTATEDEIESVKATEEDKESMQATEEKAESVKATKEETKSVLKAKPAKEKPKAKEEYKKMPVRSLTEEEYDEIFDGAIENAMKLDLETWQPRFSSPIKVREPKKKKYSKTVGKKSKLQEVKPEEPSADCTVPDPDKNADDHKEEPVEDDENSEGFDVTIEMGEGLDKEDEDDAVPAHDHQGDQKEEESEGEQEQSDVQKENETTPAASETGSVCVSPPPKKKKVHLKKKEAIEPKSLQFDKTKTTPMIDKIKKLKKMKKENQSILKKRKADLPSDNKAIKKKKKNEDSSDSKPKLKKTSMKKQMLDRDLDMDGTWVQCCNTSCMKWRHLPDVCDPSQIPDRWTCSMNTCEDYNSCDKPEQAYDETEHIYTRFTEGSIVWAKMAGYPWWPAMVEQDPDTLTFFSIDSDDSMIPTHFHVVFFDDKVSRTWVKSSNIKSYTGDEEADDVKVIKMTKRGANSYTKDVGIAKKNANRAIKCSLQTRIELFGFAVRFKGAWGKTFETASPEIQDKRSEGKKPKKKAEKRQPSMMETVELDESTMDDVLDNTDAILDNVEELLDSLDSQLDDDSDNDSNFLPDELVVVEKKNMKKIRGTESHTKKRNKQKKNCIDSSSESEDESDIHKDSDMQCEEDKQSNEETIENPQKDTCSLETENNFVNIEKKGEDNTEQENCEEKSENMSESEKSQRKNKSENMKQKCMDKTKKKEKNLKKVKNSDTDNTYLCTNENNSEDESRKNRTDVASQKHTQAKKSVCDSKPSLEEEETKKDGDEVDLDEDQNSCDKADTDNNNQSNHKDDKQGTDDKESAKSDKQLDLADDQKIKDVSDNKDKVCENIEYVDMESDDSDSEFDLGEGNEDNKEAAIGELSEDKSDSEFDLGEDDKNNIKAAIHVSQPSEDESDSDFELEESSMYESVVDGAQKNRERADSPAQSLSQNSNPFDLMDEE